MKTLRALLLAQTRMTWNRTRRESGTVGPIATLAVLALIVVILSLPCVGMLWVGLHLGRDLAKTPLTETHLVETLAQWNAWMALCTVFCAFLGNFRHQPAFSLTSLGRLPIPPTQLLLAEIPVSLLEAFPILGAAGLICSHIGLAIRMPASSPLIAFLAVQGLITMLALLLFLAALRRDLARHRVAPLILGLMVALGITFLDLDGLRWLINVAIPSTLPWLPVSQGYAGLIDLRLGQWAIGAGRLAFALVGSLALIAAASWMHQRERSREQTASASQRARSKPLRFNHPAIGVGRLFQKQLMSSKLGRATLVAPLFMTLPVALLAGMVDALLEKDGVWVDQLAQIQRLNEIPLIGGLFFLIVIMDTQIWMNQFGWDQDGVRTLLLLPLAPRDLLLGKLIGLTRHAGLQALIGLVPLLWVHPPGASEVVAGLAAAGTGLVVTVGVGHWLSARFPRRVTPGASTTLPLYLAWMPSVLVMTVLGVLMLIGLIARSFGSWALPAAWLATFVLCLLAYLHYLPQMGTWVHAQRERLLRM